jgi:hypothetical protein
MTERILDNIVKPSYEQLADKLNEKTLVELKAPKPFGKKQVNIRISNILLDGLEEFQAQYGVGASWVIEKLLVDFLQKVRDRAGNPNWRADAFATDTTIEKIL